MTKNNFQSSTEYDQSSAVSEIKYYNNWPGYTCSLDRFVPQLIIHKGNENVSSEIIFQWQ